MTLKLPPAPVAAALAAVVAVVLVTATLILARPSPTVTAAPVVAGDPCARPAVAGTGIEGTPASGAVLVGTLAVPATAEAGPSRLESGVRTCWERSPTGAVFAATYMAGLGATGQAPVLHEHLAVPGPGRDAALAGAVANVPASTEVVFSGFRLLDYTPDAAQVMVVATVEGVHTQGMILDVVWDGDWRLDPPSTGEPVRVPVRAGTYTPFAPAVADPQEASRG